MSEINDALKRARQAAPGAPDDAAKPPPSLPRRWGVHEKPSVLIGWIIPLFIIVLIFAGIFFIGRATAHHTIHKVIATQIAILSTQQVTDVVPVFQPIPPPPAPPAPAPPVVVAPVLPKLQGIFYAGNASTAILDGKTVAAGDRFGDYRVKEISRYTVTLTDTNGKEIKVGMGN